MATFFDRYAALCNEKGKSVNGIAKEIGLPSSNITNWKNGKSPRAGSLKKIADYFGVTVDYLQGYTDIKEKPPAETGDIRKQAEEIIARMDHDQLLEFIAKATEKLREK